MNKNLFWGYGLHEVPTFLRVKEEELLMNWHYFIISNVFPPLKDEVLHIKFIVLVLTTATARYLCFTQRTSV
jgi:hypothetical protein